MKQFDKIEEEIFATPATTLEGLFVKAKIGCSDLLGDLEPNCQLSTHERIAVSIMRDLIRLYGPDLERPNALKN